MNAYERQRQAIIERNRQRLAELGIGDILNDIRASTTATKPQAPARKRRASNELTGTRRFLLRTWRRSCPDQRRYAKTDDYAQAREDRSGLRKRRKGRGRGTARRRGYNSPTRMTRMVYVCLCTDMRTYTFATCTDRLQTRVRIHVQMHIQARVQTCVQACVQSYFQADMHVACA